MALGKVYLYVSLVADMSIWLMEKQTSMAGSKVCMVYLYVAGDKLYLYDWWQDKWLLARHTFIWLVASYI